LFNVKVNSISAVLIAKSLQTIYHVGK